MGKIGTKCANNQCEHWTEKGCRLFDGKAWRQCRFKTTEKPEKGKEAEE